MGLLASCYDTPHDVMHSNSLPTIYPDYTDVVIPENIAPLNFLVKDADAVEVKADDVIVKSSGEEVVFDEKEWKDLLAMKRGKDINVTVTVRKDGAWTEYKSFKWHVADCKIDAWLSYRLIEPSGTIYSRLRMMQRSLESFEEAAISDYHLSGNRCVNCHIPGAQNSNLSMMYLRGENGGAVLNQGGKLRKLNLKTGNMVASSTYFSFSPSGRYIVFSCNNVWNILHANAYKRYEVYDKASDIYIADIQENEIFTSPLLQNEDWLVTFPTFAPDGKTIYYCAAKTADQPSEIENVKYSLVRIPFSENTGAIGTRTDTLYKEKSVCHPRVSPDGKMLLFTVQDYGTFPIHHPESELRMLNLENGEINTLDVVNSDKSDSYHSWSSNSHWFVFISKRDDGLYGLPYLCYVDDKGNAHKPFCLPQKDPHFYENNLYSFNAPELVNGKLPFNAIDIEMILKREPEQFTSR